MAREGMEKSVTIVMNVIIIGSSNKSIISIIRSTSTSSILDYCMFKTVLVLGELRTETMIMCLKKIWLKND